MMRSRERLRRTVGTLSLVAGSSFLTACSPHPRAERCAAGAVARLYLGQATPTGVVSEAQWQRFVIDAVTPRFPDGFTVLDGKGQWRAPDGVIRQESTRVLEIAHDGTPLTQARVRAVAKAYEHQFSQHSVLVTQALSSLCP
jgi:hypothetical protein